MRRVNAIVVRAGEGRVKQLRRGRGAVEVLVDASDGAVQVDMHINTIRAGTDPGPRHYHSNGENAYLILEGTAEITVEDDVFVVTPGDFLFIPPGLPHSVHNPSKDNPVRLIEVYAPAAIDFTEC